jgi:hypothetical protein
MSLRERRITLALNAYRSGQFKSRSASASWFKASKNSVIRRDRGIPPRTNLVPYNRKLTITEETTLVEWILEMDTRGLSVTKATIRQKAELLLVQRHTDASNPPPSIGVNWTSNFIARHPQLQLKYNRKYDYQRALCESPQLVNHWFLLVRNTVNK